MANFGPGLVEVVIDYPKAPESVVLASLALCPVSVFCARSNRQTTHLGKSLANNVMVPTIFYVSLLKMTAFKWQFCIIIFFVQFYCTNAVVLPKKIISLLVSLKSTKPGSQFQTHKMSQLGMPQYHWIRAVRTLVSSIHIKIKTLKSYCTSFFFQNIVLLYKKSYLFYQLSMLKVYFAIQIANK